MARFLNGKTLRKSSQGPSPAFAAAFEAAKHFVPTSEFLTAPDVLDDSAVSFICAVFVIPGILSLPNVDGFLSALFTLIAPIVPAEIMALREIGNVGWQQLRPGHPNSVIGQLRQILLIGFILAMAVKCLVHPDCLVIPAPVAPGVIVRSSSPSTSAPLSARVESIELQLALVLAAAARSDAMKARLLAALPALLTSQLQSRLPLPPDPVLPPAAGTAGSAHPPVVISSGGGTQRTRRIYTFNPIRREPSS